MPLPDPADLYDLDADRPDLTGAVLVQALDGFVDAGSTVKLAREHLLSAIDHRVLVRFDADALHDAVADYAPTGETPIAYALQQAATDLGPDGNRTVVLVSDGIATCDPDPCEVAEQGTVGQVRRA